MNIGPVSDSLRLFFAPREPLAQEKSLTAQAASAAGPTEAADFAGPPERAGRAGSGDLMSRNFSGGRGHVASSLDGLRAGMQAAERVAGSRKSALASMLGSLVQIAGPSLYDPHGNPKNADVSEATLRRIIKRMGERQIMEDAREAFEQRKKAGNAEEALATDNNGSAALQTSPPLPAATTAPVWSGPAAGEPVFEDGAPTPLSVDVTV